MKDSNFSFYKTLYLTRQDPHELPDHRKDTFKEFEMYHDDFVNGEIELGKRYRVEVFNIPESWNVKTEDYLHFFESHKENLIGSQVSDVIWYELGNYLNKKAKYSGDYSKKENENLWVDSLKKSWVPSIDLFGIPFYFWLGFINPDFDADNNCVFLFYPFEEGTEDLYEPLLVEGKKTPPEVKSSFYDCNDNPYSARNSRDLFVENYLGLPEFF